MGGRCFGALFQGVDPMEGEDEFNEFLDEEEDWQNVRDVLFGV